MRLVPRSDRQVRIRSLDLGHLVEYHLEEGPEYDGVMDLPKAAIARMRVESGLDVDIESDAPPGSGLGGSSALVTACAALATLTDRRLGRAELARLAYGIERDDLGIAGGWQDQYATAFGGFNLLEFGADEVDAWPLALSDDAIAELRSHLLLCYTGRVRTDLGLIHDQIRMYEDGREDTIVGMKQLHAMAYEMKFEIEAGNLDRLGPLLGQAFESKKLMNPNITDGTRIERLFEVAEGAGASGGKICGAGGGGYLLLACGPRRNRRSARRSNASGDSSPRSRRRLGPVGDRAWRRRGQAVGGAVEPEASAARGKRFVLLDRDGTINEEIGYVLRPDELRLIPGAAGALRELQTSGSGSSSSRTSPRSVAGCSTPRARGDPRPAPRAPRRCRRDARPDRGLPAPARRGMRVPQARHADGRARGRRPRVRPAESWIVGDHAADLRLGRAVGARTILVRTGHGEGSSPAARMRSPTTSSTISRRRRP